MTQFTLKNVLHVLNLMAESETLMSELYKTASRSWSSDWQFWQDLSGQEMRHAECVEKMIELISKSPDEFRLGRPITADAMNAFILRVRTAIGELEKKAISKSRFISLVLNFEQQIIESNYCQIVITGNAGYKALEKEILSETASHKEKLTSLQGSCP